MKDHELTKLTNELTEIAKEYATMDQLRIRISNKLKEYIKTDNNNTIKIAVPTEAVKEELIKESRYIHDHRKIDTEKCNGLAHLYMLPDDSWDIAIPDFLGSPMNRIVSSDTVEDVRNLIGKKKYIEAKRICLELVNNEPNNIVYQRLLKSIHSSIIFERNRT